MLFSIILFSCGENIKEIKNSDNKILNDSLTYLNHSDSAKYVGMNTCKLCHQNIYNTFIETGMGQSFGIASKTKSLAEFKNACIKDNSTNYNYCAYWQKDSLYIKEFLLEKNDTLYSRTEQVNYIIGSGQHTNSHLQNVNGYLNQMPMTFFTQKNNGIYLQDLKMDLIHVLVEKLA